MSITARSEAMRDKAMQALPETGFLRLSQIVGRPATKKTPAVYGIIPVARSTWWKGVAEGRFPAPVKLGPNTTAWRVSDIRALIDNGTVVVGGAE